MCGRPGIFPGEKIFSKGIDIGFLWWYNAIVIKKGVDNMNIWILMVRECEGWETINVLFEAAAVEPNIKEIFAEHTHYKCVRVEHWHRDDADSPNANFYGVEDFYNDDEVPTLFFEDA